jgi:thiosulfate reductase cytochrome b subunit
MRGGRSREIELVVGGRDGVRRRAKVEHPYAVRLAHWAIAIALPVLAMSGLQILLAFPSFGPKLPPGPELMVPRWATLGGWLAGGIQWHFTFMWLFLGAGAAYLVYQIVSGNWRQVIVSRRDLPGVVPMLRHYLRGHEKPVYDGTYNPLQKLAYTVVIALLFVQALSGLALWRPAQLSFLVALMGGFQGVRIVHFVAMCALLAFIPGHLLLVALAGWRNLKRMIVGFETEAPAEKTVDPG